MILSPKNLAKQVTPPFLSRLARRVRPSRNARRTPAGTEQAADFYDETFLADDHWREHYTRSRYYPLWTVVADRLRRQGTGSILDIGCGPGQVACVVRDLGIEHYLGIDFSPAHIEHARNACPDYRFTQTDAFKTELFDSHEYDTVLCMAFLEHVDRDTEVLDRIRPGTFVLATVPNFPAYGHVRHFTDVEEVRRRYEPHLASLRVDAIIGNEKGQTFFLIEGRR